MHTHSSRMLVLYLHIFISLKILLLLTPPFLSQLPVCVSVFDHRHFNPVQRRRLGLTLHQLELEPQARLCLTFHRVSIQDFISLNHNCAGMSGRGLTLHAFSQSHWYAYCSRRTLCKHGRVSDSLRVRTLYSGMSNRRTLCKHGRVSDSLRVRTLYSGMSNRRTLCKHGRVSDSLRVRPCTLVCQ